MRTGFVDVVHYDRSAFAGSVEGVRTPETLPGTRDNDGLSTKHAHGFVLRYMLYRA